MLGYLRGFPATIFIPLAGPLTQSKIDNIVFVSAKRSLNPKKPKYTRCFAKFTT